MPACHVGRDIGRVSLNSLQHGWNIKHSANISGPRERFPPLILRQHYKRQGVAGDLPLQLLPGCGREKDSRVR